MLNISLLGRLTNHPHFLCFDMQSLPPRLLTSICNLHIWKCDPPMSKGSLTCEFFPIPDNRSIKTLDHSIFLCFSLSCKACLSSHHGSLIFLSLCLCHLIPKRTDKRNILTAKVYLRGISYICSTCWSSLHRDYIIYKWTLISLTKPQDIDQAPHKCAHLLFKSPSNALFFLQQLGANSYTLGTNVG